MPSGCDNQNMSPDIIRRSLGDSIITILLDDVWMSASVATLFRVFRETELIGCMYIYPIELVSEFNKYT